MQEQLRTLFLLHPLAEAGCEAMPKVKGWEVVVPPTHEGKLLADTSAIRPLVR